MRKDTIIKDLLAGLTVSFAALSLGAAFGTMSGRGAFAGMIGAAVIPLVTSTLGGTRLQASGPTAPMTAVTALLVAQAYELFPNKILAEQFITLVILLSGAIMVVGGLVRLGQLIKWVPNAVVLGFMNGIAVLIWYDQIGKIFGLAGKTRLGGGAWLNFGLTVVTVATIFTLPVLIKRVRVPAKYRAFFSALLLTILLLTTLAHLLQLPVERVVLGATVDSWAEFTDLVGSYWPTAAIFTPAYLGQALPLAGQLALLGYLDSLLTALVIDRLTKEHTRSNQELVAQGLANALAGLLQGIPGAQATIRSVLLVKEQAQTRFAGVALGVFVLLSLFFFKNYIALIPAAVFAGVLIKAGWDVCDRLFPQLYFKRGWGRFFNRNFQFFIVLYTTLATVLSNLNVAVITGAGLFYGLRWLLKSRHLPDVEEDLEAS
ncbi:MAG: SulP family inorganic anion transporter [Bernardetiaceae bacterium]|nr:SulP family inorganic anion transporter [Bernardetiaceae bacterium]